MAVRCEYEYVTVKTKLLEMIDSGLYKPGDRINTERELCDVFKVSRITVRQALSELEKEGWIQRIQGRGTFVRQHMEEKSKKMEQLLSYNYSFSEELKKNNIVPGTRVLSLTRISAQLPLAEKFGLNPGAMLDVLLRLRLADGEPYAYETSYIPSEYLNGATAEEIARDGLYNTMEKKSGIRPNKAVEIFEAAIAPGVIAEALGRKGLLSVMQIEHTAYLNQKAVEYCNSYVAGDRYRFRVKLE